jgi:hypothetical protein
MGDFQNIEEIIKKNRKKRLQVIKKAVILQRRLTKD